MDWQLIATFRRRLLVREAAATPWPAFVAGAIASVVVLIAACAALLY